MSRCGLEDEDRYRGDIMRGKAILAVLAAALTLGGSACTVMQSTYDRKVDEADTLAKKYAALQQQYDELSAENAGLKALGDVLDETMLESLVPYHPRSPLISMLPSVV